MSLLATETALTFGCGGTGCDPCPPIDPGVIDCGNQLEKSMTLNKEAEAAKALQIAKYNELKERKLHLEQLLSKKMEELYNTCAQEAAITGVIPQETPYIRGKPPLTIMKKIGTEYTLPAKFLSPDKKESSKVNELEIHFEIQRQQMEAVLKLSQDKSLARNVRRKYRQQYRDSHLKLKQLEEKLNVYRRQAGRSLINIPDTVEDPDDLLSPHPDSQQDSADTGSLASQQSCHSEGHTSSRSKSKSRRVKSSGQQNQLNHLSGSLPKMEIQEYEKPPSLLSPVRSISSNSLQKDHILSSAEANTPDIKIYPKMIHRSLNSPQVNPFMFSFNQKPNLSSSSSQVDNGVGTGSSTSGRRTNRRQMRVSTSASQKHPPSPNPSDCSDISEGQTTGRKSTSDGMRRGSNKYSVTSCNGHAAYNHTSTTSTPITGDLYRHDEPVFSPVEGGNTLSPESYEEQTRTWPRKRGNKSNRRRPSEEVSPAPEPSAAPVVIEKPTCADSLDLAELSPSKYGCKRDSTVDRQDSLHYSFSPHDVKSVASYGSDTSVTPMSSEDVSSRVGRMSTGGHYSSSPYASKFSSDRHRQHNVSIIPLQWDQSPQQQQQHQNAVDLDYRAEHILLSQGRRQSSSSVKNRYDDVNTTPGVDGRTLYEPYQYVVGNVSGDPFSSPGYSRGQRQPTAGYSHPSSSSAAFYSPNLAAGRTQSSTAASMPPNRAAVDALFDSLYKTDDASPYGTYSPDSSMSARPPPQPAPAPLPHWCEPTIRSVQSPSSTGNRRNRSHAVSGYTTLPTHPHIVMTSSSTVSSSSRHRNNERHHESAMWRPPPPDSRGRDFGAVEISPTSTLV